VRRQLIAGFRTCGKRKDTAARRTAALTIFSPAVSSCRVHPNYFSCMMMMCASRRRNFRHYPHHAPPPPSSRETKQTPRDAAPLFLRPRALGDYYNMGCELGKTLRALQGTFQIIGRTRIHHPIDAKGNRRCIISV
jgi:hypothetical protein